MSATDAELAEIAALLAPGSLTSDRQSRENLSMDVFEWADEQVADLVLAPTDTQSVSAAIGWAAQKGFSIAPRGGGMSYTRGFQPRAAKIALLDLRKLHGIRQLSVDDRMVVVAAGTTWVELEEALAPHGLRPALEGPISGAVSTIGGAVSQNMPAGMQHVLGLELVLADGRIVATGALARPGGPGALRASGPDLTGLFIGDCGALAVKTAVAIRLAPRPAAAECASFGFADPIALVEAMAAIRAQNIDIKLMGLASRSVRDSAKAASLAESLALLRRTIDAAPSKLSGIGRAARLALSGARQPNAPWGLHLTAEGPSKAVALAILDAARRCMPPDAVAMEPTVPLAMLSRFYSVRGMLGPKGERWAPVHGVFPLSRIAPATRAVERYFASMQDRMAQAGMTHSMMFSAQDTSVLVEPMIYWPDSIRAVHENALRPDLVKRFAANPANTETRALAREIRTGLRDVLLAEGAMMAQLGRFYPYDALVQRETLDLARSLKNLLDPEGMLNPGNLGWNRPE